MPFRSPSHYWVHRLGRPDDLAVVAVAAALTRSALDALDVHDVELAARFWVCVDGEAQHRIWNEQVNAQKNNVPETLPPPEVVGATPPQARLSTSLSRRVFETRPVPLPLLRHPRRYHLEGRRHPAVGRSVAIVHAERASRQRLAQAARRRQATQHRAGQVAVDPGQPRSPSTRAPPGADDARQPCHVVRGMQLREVHVDA
jgi:hypothetical protein